MTAITVEQIQEFMDFLTGNKLPEGFTFQQAPKLTRKQAFSVVYYLQEALAVIPDNIEMCQVCGELFDYDSDGFILDGTSPDEWHKSHGVTPEMLLANDSAQFCSEQCEISFWRSQEARRT